MAQARLSVWIFLFISLRSIPGQLCSNNNSDKSGVDITNQLIALQKKINQQNHISNNNGNQGINLVLQNNKLIPQQIGSMQRNLQQPATTCQQTQQPILNQQQSLTNQILQQTGNQQSSNAQLQSLPVTNLQLVQTPISTSEITFSPLPMINNQFSGLPSQVSQGVLLSNLGLTSSLPSLLPNACGACVKQPTDQQQVIPQNIVSTLSNLPISTVNSQGTIPASITTSSIQPKCSCVNNPSSTYTLPVNLQNRISQQNQQVLQLPQTLTIAQSQPLQSQNQIPTMYQQIQQQPVAQSQPVQLSTQTQPSLPCFSLSSNTQPNAISSSGYPSNMVLPLMGNYGEKPSGMRALLPLIMNMIKDKSCCNCQANNCGCNSPCNKNNVQQPQITSGYSNTVKVIPVAKEENVTEVNTGEKETTKDADQDIKPADPKDNSNHEEEDDDDDDYYDDFDENSE